MKNSANIMETTFCNPKECPKEYLNGADMVMRNGQWVNITAHNQRVNRKWKPKKHRRLK